MPQAPENREVISGALYSVALPIGNAADLSQRARSVLEGVDFIACEDTRKLTELFRRAQITTRARFLVHNAFSEAHSAEGLLRLLRAGQAGALVSDAGTPRLSDPGSQILKLCYAHNVQVIPVPGPSALTALISVTPFSVDPLLFLGFLSPKPGRRQNELKKYAGFGGALALFESVHRIEKTLADIVNIFGDGEIIIGRELTKTHEELFCGHIAGAQAWVKGKQGEFALIFRRKFS